MIAHVSAAVLDYIDDNCLDYNDVPARPSHHGGRNFVRGDHDMMQPIMQEVIKAMKNMQVIDESSNNIGSTYSHCGGINLEHSLKLVLFGLSIQGQ